MAVSLPGLPDKLRALSSRLTIDTQIQTELTAIIEDAVKCSNTFSKAFKEDTEQLHIQNELFKQATDPRDVNVKSLQTVLTNTRTNFTSSRMELLELQTKVHSQIENCRGQVKKHQEEQTTKKGQVDSKGKEILRHKETIDQNEKDAADLDKVAKELSDHADNLDRMERKKRKRGKLGKIAGAALGIVFAPVTGGASLLVGSAAAAIIGGVNQKDANDCRNRATSSRESANDKRKSAGTLRDDVKNLETTIGAIEKEIGQLTDRIGTLEDAITVLEDMTSLLRSSVGVSDEVINIIMDMDSSMIEPLLKAQTFSLSQKSENEDMAKKQMEKLKESLSQVQDVIGRNRRFALED